MTPGVTVPVYDSSSICLYLMVLLINTPLIVNEPTMVPDGCILKIALLGGPPVPP